MKSAVTKAKLFVSTLSDKEITNEVDTILNQPLIPGDFFVCFVDASFINHENPSGLAGILVTEKYEWVAGFERRVIVRDVLLAELYNIKEVIALAV